MSDLNSVLLEGRSVMNGGGLIATDLGTFELRCADDKKLEAKQDARIRIVGKLRRDGGDVYIGVEHLEAVK